MQDKLSVLRPFFERSCKHISALSWGSQVIHIGTNFEISQSEGEFTLYLCLADKEFPIVHEIYTDTDFEQICKRAVLAYIERCLDHVIDCRETERQGKETF